MLFSKILVLSIFFSFLTLVYTVSFHHGDKVTINELKLFQNFIEKYNKHYHSEAEFQVRFKNFKASLRRSAEKNEYENDFAVYGVTRFSDLTPDEFKAAFTKNINDLDSRLIDNINIAENIEKDDGEIPDTFDWRDLGVVTSVKDQGDCRAYYAFSAIGNIEGQYALVTGNLTDLSAQQLVDCDNMETYCGGGWPIYAMQNAIIMGGVETDEDYPYTRYQGDCLFDKSKVFVKVKTTNSFPNDEDVIKMYVYQKGPLSACLNSNLLMDYQSGIINPVNETCFDFYPDHCALIVGYGVDPIPFWTVKNSWGGWYGENGYFRIARGIDACGIAQNVTTVVL